MDARSTPSIHTQDLYRLILSHISDTVLVTDGEGRFTFICPNVETIFGYTAQEVLDLGGIDALLGPALFDPERLQAQGELSNIECTVRDKQGREHTLLVSVKALSIGEGSVLYVCRDVTERKQVDLALRASEERFRQLADNAPDIIFRYRLVPTLQCEYISAALLNILGYRPEEFYAHPEIGLELVHADDRRWLVEQFSTTGPTSFQIRWLHKDGRVIWMEQRVVFIRDDAGNLVALEGIARDITAQKANEEKTHRHVEEITLLNQVIAITALAQDFPAALQDICAELAHFFRSPQAGVALFNSERTALEVIAEYQEEDRPSGIGIVIPIEGNPSMDYVLTHRAPLAVANAQTDPLLAPVHEIMRQRNVHSILLVPILVGDEVAGTLGFDFRSERTFSAGEIALAQNAANQVGQTLQRLRLFTRAQEHARLMAQLAALGETLNRSFTMAEVVKAIGEGALALAGAARAALYVRGLDDTISCAWSSGLSATYLEQVLLNVGNAPDRRLLEQTSPLLFSDLELLPPETPLRRLTRAEGIRAYALWPLFYEGKVIAALGCYYNQPHHWSQSEREVTEAFARQAAVALENARLFDETRRRAEELEHLSCISAELRAAPTRQAIQSVVLKALSDLFEVSGAALALHDPARNQAIFEFVLGEWSQKAGTRVSLETSITGQVMTTGQPFVIDDHRQHPALSNSTLFSTGHALACVPLIVDRIAIGALWMVRRQPFRDSEIRLMIAVADIAANAIQRTQIVETLEQRVLERTRELAEANEQLTELDRLKSKFVSDVSHELRTPIQNLKMYLELMEKGRPEKRHHYLETLKEQADWLQHLTEEILDLSRLELSTGKLRFGPVDLNKLVAQVTSALRPSAESAHLTLSMTLDPGLPSLLGEGNRLAQVVTNLLTNAINYTPSGQISVATYQVDEGICLQVEDTGIGIASEDKPHLFERFYRSNRVSQSNMRGTGLGLAIVKEIVDIHGGHIQVESDEGTGATFRVWLPLRNQGLKTRLPTK